jgi:integrase
MAVTDLPPNQLTAAHLRGLADLHKDHPATARHRFGATSRFLDWLVDEETLEINPAHMVSRRRRPGTPEARSRVLAAEEVRKIWKGCLQLPEPYGDLFRFMILVPLRRGEASKLTAEMIDGDRLILPHMITKNGDPFTIPLPQQAEEILTYRTAEGLLFASQRTGRPVQGWGTMLAKLHELSGTTGWSLHDFRRTFTSQLAEATVPSDVTDALLNHRQAATRPGVIGVYNLSKLMSPKTKAMATWGLMVEHAVATGRFDHDGNVVSLTA